MHQAGHVLGSDGVSNAFFSRLRFLSSGVKVVGAGLCLPLKIGYSNKKTLASRDKKQTRASSWWTEQDRSMPTVGIRKHEACCRTTDI